MTLAKAKVESGVQIVQRWIVAALRNRKFFNLEETNQAVGELLVQLNQRPFRKREGSLAVCFKPWTGPRYGRCLPSGSISVNGHAPR
jgi:hypothetical protein